jgi:hypothetical protein
MSLTSCIPTSVAAAQLKAGQKLKSGTYSNQVGPSHLREKPVVVTTSQLKLMVKPQLVAMDTLPTPTKQSPVDIVIIQLHAQPVNSTPLNVVPTTPPRTNPPLSQSTPVKIGTSTTCPFTTNQKYCVESYTAMEEEIENI